MLDFQAPASLELKEPSGGRRQNIFKKTSQVQLQKEMDTWILGLRSALASPTNLLTLLQTVLNRGECLKRMGFLLQPDSSLPPPPPPPSKCGSHLLSAGQQV